MNAVIYVRTSTTKQNTSRQEQECINYANQKGYTVLDIIVEQKSSYRCNTKELYGLIQKINSSDKSIHAIVTNCVDRFSRNLFAGLEMMDILQKKGIRLDFVKDNIDTSTLEGRRTFGHKLVEAQFHSEKLGQSLRRTYRVRKFSGRPCSQPAYGKTRDGTDNNEEQLIIRIIQTARSCAPLKETVKLVHEYHMRYAPRDIPPTYQIFMDDTPMGLESGYSLTYENIAEMLNVYGITKRGKEWTMYSVMGILKSETAPVQKRPRERESSVDMYRKRAKFV